LRYGQRYAEVLNDMCKPRHVVWFKPSLDLELTLVGNLMGM